MFNRIFRLIVKELIQVFRDKRMRVYIFMPPLIQLLIFGYAANLDVHHVRTAVVDNCRCPASRELLDLLGSSQYFDVVALPPSLKSLEPLFDYGRITLGLSLPADLAANLASGRTARIQLLVDGTQSQSAQVASAYAAALIQDFGRRKQGARLEVLKGQFANDTVERIKNLVRGVESAYRVWYNPNLVSRNFFVPGIVALILTIMSLSLTSMNVVRERELGTLEQLLVTPLRSGEFILGKTLPIALIGYLQATLVLLVGVFLFHIPFKGALLFFYACVGLYLITSLAVGLFISTISKTQQQAMTTTFLFLFPAVLFSGFVFPIYNMPRLIQWLTYLNPLRYFIRIIRDIFLVGSSPWDLAFDLGVLLIMGPAILALAASRVRRSLK